MALAPSPLAAETRAEVARSNLETGEAAVYVAPGGVGAYDTATGTTASAPGLSYPVIATLSGAGTTRTEGTTTQMDDRIAVLTGLAPEVAPQEGGRLTTATEDYAIVGVQGHAIGGYPVSHTLRLRDK